jgi:hypothetical protein
VSRFKTTVLVLFAAVLMLAAGTPAGAETVAGKARAEMGQEVAKKPVVPSWWRWIRLKLSRYAMAAN